MGKHYNIDRSQDFRKVKIEIVIGILLLVILIFGGIYVAYDLNNNNLAVDDTNNTAVLGSVGSTKEGNQLYDAETYQIKVPTDWRRVNNPEVTVGSKRYYPDRYQGTSGDHVGRKIDVYINDIPANLGIDKVVSVLPNNNRVIIDELSGQCYYFTDFPDGKAGNVYPSRWEEKEITFSCRTSLSSNVVGAINEDQASGVSFKYKGEPINYLIVYTDHGSARDNSIFFDALESFRVK